MTLRLSGSPPDGQPAVSYLGSPTGKMVGSVQINVGSVSGIGQVPSSRIQGIDKSQVGYILSVPVAGGSDGPDNILFSAPTAVLGVSPTDRARASRTLVEARMRVASAPAGSDLVATVQHWNGFSWEDVSTLTIPNGSVTEVVDEFSQHQTAGNMARLNVTSIGATTAASGVVVEVLVN